MDLNSKFFRVGVIYGGNSDEREISINSGKAVIDSLKKLGIGFVAIDAPKNKLTNILLSNKIERCFIMLHGGEGENGVIQNLLDKLKIPYTGSRSLACALAMDKVRAKKVWQKNGLLTPKFKVIMHDIDIVDLKFPLAIKPINQGSSIGIHKANTVYDVVKIYKNIRQYGKIMAEEWIEGEEFTVSIVDNIPLPSIRIKPQLEFYNYEAKYNKAAGTIYQCPSGLLPKLEEGIKNVALKAFNMLGCSGWGRVDFMLSKNHELYLLEVNTIPGMTNTSLLPKAAKCYGWSFEELVIKILKSSL